MIKEIERSKSTLYFKVKLVKLLDKYPKTNCLSLSVNFLKDYAKTIKETCKERVNQIK